VIDMERVFHLYESRGTMTRQQKLKVVPEFIGSAFSAKHVSRILDLPYYPTKQALGGAQPTGRFVHWTVPDIWHIVYLYRLSGTIDKDVLERVVSAGTSAAMVARILGFSRQYLWQLVNKED
jgi:hypothetical protein